MKALFSVLSLLMMLAGCAPQGMRMVDAKDDAAFVSMYRAMKPAMQQKALVDRTGSWYEPLISTGPKDAGLVFLDRLSPKFCSAELNEPVVKSFRYMTVPGDQVKLDDWGVSIRTAEYTVEIKLVAVTDWDGNGKDDWLAICRVRLAAAPDQMREYFLQIAVPEAAKIEPYVLMERRHAYGRAAVVSDNSLTHFLGAVTEEVEQGQTVVTQAPSAQSRIEQTNLRSSSLRD